MKKLNQKSIIIALLSLLAVSFIYLALVEEKQQSYDYQKNWWALYFQDTKDNSLDFIIENHSAAETFHWEIISEKDKPSQEGDIKVAKGEVKNIVVKADDPENKRIVIIVSDGKNKKTIYKDFRK